MLFGHPYRPLWIFTTPILIPGIHPYKCKNHRHISSNFNFFQVSCKILNKHFAYIYIYWIYHPMHIKKRTYKWYITATTWGIRCCFYYPTFLYKGNQKQLSSLLRIPPPLEGSKASRDDESERMAKSGQLLNVPWDRRWDLWDFWGIFWGMDFWGGGGFIVYPPNSKFRIGVLFGVRILKAFLPQKKEVGMSLIPNFQEFRP